MFLRSTKEVWVFYYSPPTLFLYQYHFFPLLL